MRWWILGVPLVPLVFCGLMCVGAVVLAALGMRRRDEEKKTAPQADAEAGVGH